MLREFPSVEAPDDHSDDGDGNDYRCDQVPSTRVTHPDDLYMDAQLNTAPGTAP
jgi:hypothetical protein